MDGLECSIINLQEVCKAPFRLDAEYYSKEIILLDNFIKTHNGKTITAINGETECSAFYPSITGEYSNDTTLVPFLRVNEIQRGLISLTDSTVYLPQKVLDDNPKTIKLAYPYDIIIAKGGNTLAKVGLVTSQYEQYATCRDVIILHTNSLSINRYYLWAYLHSKFGQALMWRNASQTGQPHITLPSIQNMYVPIVSIDFQNVIQRAYELSVKLSEHSNEKYNEAEDYLLRQINGNTSSLSSDNISVKSFSESFAQTGRLDAEYYQKKHYQLIDELNTRKSIGNTCYIYDKNYKPDDDSEYKYIELANIGVAGEISGVESMIGSSLPTRARRLVRTGDVIVSSIEGSLESCALITEEYNNSLCSTGFYVLNSSEYNSETLLALLKSDPIQSLLKRGCSGTILTSISKEEFRNIPLPEVPINAQEIIKEKISKVYALRNQSKIILDAAKKAVEMAIEQSEEAAITWLNNTISEIEASTK